MEVVKVPTGENLADALTKEVESETLELHVHGVGADVRRGRHDLAPKTEDEESEELDAQRNLSLGEKCFIGFMIADEWNVLWGSNVGMLSSGATYVPTFRSIQIVEIDTMFHDTMFS